MLRRLLLLALCVFPAIAIECDKCTGKDCSEICYLRQKVRSTEAKYKCSSASATTTTTTTNEDDGSAAGVDQCFNDGEGCDGSAAGVDQCFMDGGSCASCCGACTITTDLDNQAKDSCVCYEASSAPSGRNQVFYGTNNNDCVFIEADHARYIWVRNQCLEVPAQPRRGSRYSGRVESVRP